MADYAPNFTARYKLIYSTEGDQHQCVIRLPSANSLLTNTGFAETFWNSFLSLTDDLRHETFAIIGAEYCQPDSNTFMPLASTPTLVPGTITSASGPSTKIIASNWAGRTVLGTKARFYFFGLRWNTADSTEYLDFRVTDAENPVVGFVAEALLTNNLVGPDDEALAQVYPRVTIKGNDAWVKIRRQGG